MLHPEPMADDCSPAIRTTSRPIVGSRKQPPESGADTQHLKGVSAHQCPWIAMERVSFLQVVAIVNPSKNSRKRLAPPFQGLNHLEAQRRGNRARVGLRELHANDCESFRIGHRQTLNHETVDQAEDRRIGTEAQLQRADPDMYGPWR